MRANVSPLAFQALNTYVKDIEKVDHAADHTLVSCRFNENSTAAMMRTMLKRITRLLIQSVLNLVPK
jgi:hypothetical protein